MNIYLTGANGWLGHGFVNYVLNNPSVERIICFIHKNESDNKLKYLSAKVQVFKGDLCSSKDCETFLQDAQSDFVVHTAGVIHPKNVKEFYQINHEGTNNLLAACKNRKIKRVVAISSNSPAGVNPHRDHVFDENSPYNPYMNYGKSKVLMEKSILKYYQDGDLETVILRPPWFYGPHQPPRQSLFFSMIKEGKMPFVGDGSNLRSMAYIENICLGIMLALTVEKANGQIYWIADAKPYSMTEIINTIENLLENEYKIECKKKYLRLPYVAGTVATMMDASIQGLGLYNQKIHVLSELNKTIACSITKAKTELGYSPQIDLYEGMKRSIKWCLESGIKI